MENSSPNVAAIIVAAGRGRRAQSDTPKQWHPLCGQSVAQHAVDAFHSHDAVDEIVVVHHKDDHALAAELRHVTKLAIGGETRAASVKAGLDALVETHPDIVLIHDAARACVTQSVITNCLTALEDHDGAAPAVAITDTLWRDDHGNVGDVVSRDGLFRAQTPQGFHFAKLAKAYATAPVDATDDVSVARHGGLDVAIVQGSEDNLKITTPEDFHRAKQILKQRRTSMTVRMGNGFDVHKFGEGDHVTLCGVDIAHSHGLVGHSDADVAMHAITDAIYGALAEGDIGQHFPPTDPQWKGAASDIFLRHANERVSARGYQISNIDCTLVCEFPKIGPHAQTMRRALAEILKIPVENISVKATTSEQLGFTGRGEGIASLASVVLVAQ